MGRLALLAAGLEFATTAQSWSPPPDRITGTSRLWGDPTPNTTVEIRRTDDEPVVRMSLREMVQRAVANNLEVKVQGYEPAVEATRVVEAEARFDPTVFASAQYEDLNLLAISLVKPGGIFVTCSCSGLLSLEDFEQHVIKAAHRQNRRLQFFDRTGPGPDHPVYSNCLDSRYLKVLWARVV